MNELLAELDTDTLGHFGVDLLARFHAGSEVGRGRLDSNFAQCDGVPLLDVENHSPIGLLFDPHIGRPAGRPERFDVMVDLGLVERLPGFGFERESGRRPFDHDLAHRGAAGGREPSPRPDDRGSREKTPEQTKDALHRAGSLQVCCRNSLVEIAGLRHKLL